jgi:hypothetical protein
MLPAMPQPSDDDLLVGLDLASIQDPQTRQILSILLNIIDRQRCEVRLLKEENQRLRDEVNRLKGEQGKPDIKPGPPKGFGKPHDSEAERKQARPHNKSSKNDCILIDRQQILVVPPEVLPPDALFKGHQSVVVQDLRLCRDNVLFLKEKFYSSEAGQTYLAALPNGYCGQFGPTLKALLLQLYYGCNVTEGKIASLFGHLGIQISSGQVSNMLIAGHEGFHTEAQQLFETGLASTTYQHYDHTAARVGAQNWSTHVLGNPFYTYFSTQPSRSRLSILQVLMVGETEPLRLDAVAVGWLAYFGVPQAKITAIGQAAKGEFTDISALETVLPKLGVQHKARVLEAVMLSAYCRHPLRVQTLVTDDAPQFKGVSEHLALCWVHEGRHYKKLQPTLPQHRQALDQFLEQFWGYYRKLRAYRDQPDGFEKAQLVQEFEALFNTKTDYWALDERIARTRAHQQQLLLVLEQPELPLHNNDAEWSARTIVRRRDISAGTKGEKGAKAWDTFLSLLLSCQKLGVSYFAYLQDRISQLGEIAPLPELLRIKAQNALAPNY